ncbi:MAG TPA: deaminase [Candidatus Paceibacterota bacterium]|nr:deaminase [Candidatus Paceibacterota bacterium]HRZ34184.1 deaminase [Candidatus Paceibacterota bacterium]
MKEYPYLPKGRQFLYVPITNEFMALAKKTALTESNDLGQPTGSVVVKDGRIIGRAANRAPLGHIRPLNWLHKKGLCIRRLLRVETGTKYWLCPGCARFSDHSEQRAIKDALKNGHNPDCADLYLWGHWWSCKPCWDKMIGAGIRDVYLLDTSEEEFRR